VNGDLTPAVTAKGRIIWLNADGEREFGPLTQQRIQVAAGLLFLLLGLLLVGIYTGKLPAAPWSPIGQFEKQTEQYENQAPAPSGPLRNA
jgi:hypothetical protein